MAFFLCNEKCRQRADYFFTAILKEFLIEKIYWIFLTTLIIWLVIVMGNIVFQLSKRCQIVTLPAPGGPFCVGRASCHLVDHSRIELFSEQKAKRELFAWIWYPAEHVLKKEPVSYLPLKWGQQWNRIHGPFPFDLLLQRADTIHTHSFANVPISNGKERYPVLIFEPGLGRLPTDYTTLIEDLVSHGYVVVGIVPTYEASVVVFPDGRTIYSVGDAKLERLTSLSQLLTVWAEDIAFVLNQLET